MTPTVSRPQARKPWWQRPLMLAGPAAALIVLLVFVGNLRLNWPAPAVQRQADLEQPSLSLASGAEYLRHSLEERLAAQHPRARIAICLAGSGRHLEVTGLALKTHVLDGFRNSDVFISSLADEFTNQWTTLRGANIVDIRLLSEAKQDEAFKLESQLLVNGSRGLRLYLFKECAEMILEQEVATSILYTWIVTAEADQYWSGWPPLPPAAEEERYYIPSVAQEMGYNDHAGIGMRDEGMEVLKRVNVLLDLNGQGDKQRPDRVFRGLLEARDVKPAFADFPFCQLTTLEESRTTSGGRMPVVFVMGDSIAWNGLVCAPCWRYTHGYDAWALVTKQEGHWGLALHSCQYSAMKICMSKMAWGFRWQAQFERVAGQAAERLRAALAERSVRQCQADWSQISSALRNTGVLPISTLCAWGRLGSPVRFRSATSSFSIFNFGLNKKSIVYSTGFVDDLAWEKHVISKYKCKVYGLEDPNLIRPFLERSAKTIPIEWLHQPYHLEAPETGNATLLTDKEPAQASSRSLQQILIELRHKKVDVLNLAIGTRIHSVVADWSRSGWSPPFCQLIVHFHGTRHALDDALETISRLVDLGFTKAACDLQDRHGNGDCLLFKANVCFSL
eukprot:SM000088S23742  [mRNA]  locus=s88:570677:575169:+ [translate_table: standard]